MLPDIIDKPFWLIASGLGYASGRSYAHTLLFSLVLLLGGFLLWRTKDKNWLVIVSIASLCHIILDGIWLNTTVFWWPLLGPLPHAAPEGFIPGVLLNLVTNPSTYLVEIAGLLMLVFMARKWRGYSDVERFLLRGKLN